MIAFCYFWFSAESIFILTKLLLTFHLFYYDKGQERIGFVGSIFFSVGIGEIYNKRKTSGIQRLRQQFGWNKRIIGITLFSMDSLGAKNITRKFLERKR